MSKLGNDGSVRPLIRDLAEERLYNALGYIKHFQEGDTMETLREVAGTAMEEWARARIGSEPLLSDAASKGSQARSAPPSEAGSTWKNWIAPCGCTVDLSRWYCPKHQAADAERHPDGAPAPAEDLEAVRNLRLCARHTVESWRAWETSKSGNEAMRAMERHRHEIGVLQNTMNFNEEALNLLLARPSPPGGPAKKEGEA
jgi:hypothetical protein